MLGIRIDALRASIGILLAFYTPRRIGRRYGSHLAFTSHVYEEVAGSAEYGNSLEELDVTRSLVGPCHAVPHRHSYF